MAHQHIPSGEPIKHKVYLSAGLKINWVQLRDGLCVALSEPFTVKATGWHTVIYGGTPPRLHLQRSGASDCSYLLNQEDWPDPEVNRRFSRAVVALRNHRGAVLYFTGGDLFCEVDSIGMDASDLGLDGGPDGIHVWEGVYEYRTFETDYGTEHESEPKGIWRALTAEEWDAVREGRHPWPGG